MDHKPLDAQVQHKWPAEPFPPFIARNFSVVFRDEFRWLNAQHAFLLILVARVHQNHAGDILRLERWLHIDIELRFQRFALPHAWLIRAANWYYVAGFLPVLVSCAVLCAWRNAGAFNILRRVFALSLSLALVGYASFPLAPPRLLPSSAGFVDTLLRYGPHY